MNFLTFSMYSFSSSKVTWVTSSTSLGRQWPRNQLKSPKSKQMTQHATRPHVLIFQHVWQLFTNEFQYIVISILVVPQEHVTDPNTEANVRKVAKASNHNPFTPFIWQGAGSSNWQPVHEWTSWDKVINLWEFIIVSFIWRMVSCLRAIYLAFFVEHLWSGVPAYWITSLLVTLPLPIFLTFQLNGFPNGYLLRKAGSKLH